MQYKKILTAVKITKVDNLYYRTEYIESITLNPHNFLGNEGDGNSDWYNELLSSDAIVQVNNYQIDPNIQLIRDKIAYTSYSEDEHFLAVIEQCYIYAPRDLAESEMSE